MDMGSRIHGHNLHNPRAFNIKYNSHAATTCTFFHVDVCVYLCVSPCVLISTVIVTFSGLSHLSFVCVSG